MKRKSYTTNSEALEKFRVLRNSTQQEQSYDNIKEMISRKIDKKVNLELRKDTSVSFYCPLGFLLSALGNSEPQKTYENLFYSNLESKYIATNTSSLVSFLR